MCVLGAGKGVEKVAGRQLFTLACARPPRVVCHDLFGGGWEPRDGARRDRKLLPQKPLVVCLGDEHVLPAVPSTPAGEGE